MKLDLLFWLFAKIILWRDESLLWLSNYVVIQYVIWKCASTGVTKKKEKGCSTTNLTASIFLKSATEEKGRHWGRRGGRGGWQLKFIFPLTKKYGGCLFVPCQSTTVFMWWTSFMIEWFELLNTEQSVNTCTLMCGCMPWLHTVAFKPDMYIFSFIHVKHVLELV